MLYQMKIQILFMGRLIVTPWMHFVIRFKLSVYDVGIEIKNAFKNNTDTMNKLTEFENTYQCLNDTATTCEYGFRRGRFIEPVVRLLRWLFFVEYNMKGLIVKNQISILLWIHNFGNIIWCRIYQIGNISISALDFTVVLQFFTRLDGFYGMISLT